MTQSVRTLAVLMTTVPEAAVPAEAALPEETAAVHEQEEEVIRREMIDTTCGEKTSKEAEGGPNNYTK